MFSSPADAVEAIRLAEEVPGIATALRLAEQAADQFPDSPEVIARYALTLLSSGRLEEAEATSQRAAELGDSVPEVLCTQLAIACFLGEMEVADRIFQRFEWTNPTCSQFTRAADFLMLAERADECRQCLGRFKDAFPDDPAVLRSLTYDPELGVAAKARLLAEFPDSHHTLVLLARDAMRERDLPRAEALFSKALEIAPESPTIISELGTTQLHQGKYKEAEASARLALSLNSRQPNALSHLAALARERGDAAEAARYTRLSGEAVPGLRSIALMKQATMLTKQGKWLEAAPIYEGLASGSSPMKSACWRMALNAYKNGRDWEGVSRLLQSAPADASGTAEVTDAKAALLVSQGRREEATQLLESAFAKHPHNGELAISLIRALREAKQESRLREVASQVSVDPPRTPAACMGLYAVLDESGCQREAGALLAKAREMFPTFSGWKMFDALQHPKEGRFAEAEAVSKTIHGDREEMGQLMTKSARNLKAMSNPLFWLKRQKKDD